MDETATRRKKIDPKLYAVGWEQVPESEILTEQRAYLIAPGRRSKISQKPKKADYVLEYKGKKLAVIEAKSDELDVSVGVEQAKMYAEMLQIRYTYSCNGDEIWFIDMGVKDAKGNYIVPSKEYSVDKFPSPQELWQMTYPDVNEWRDKFNLCGFNRDGGRNPRYYQEIAITNVLNAVSKGQDRILLTMATGTGKTYTAFQICWKLFQCKWNRREMQNSKCKIQNCYADTEGDYHQQQKPRILFIADRNILADQATNDFSQFNEDAICRITPKELKKNGYRVPTSRHLYFTIFQTMMTSPKEQQNEEKGMQQQSVTSFSPLSGETEGALIPYFMQYPKDFFDFIIIDECHRGGANDESEWRRLMDHFSSAYQLGMTATPQRKINANTYRYFGDPVYVYSLKQGISDGYLVPFRVKIGRGNADTYKYSDEDDVKGDIDKDRVYTEKDFTNGVIKNKDRDEHRVEEFLQQIGTDEKSIVFCATQEHAMIVRDLINKHKRCADSNYCERVTADDGDDGEKVLRQFQNNDRLRPTILTTSRKLSTGVDARNVRNIVLMREVNNIVEFKQIIGRGTRLFDEKYYFTIFDFVGASKNFEDAQWDGDPQCTECGNYPCTCRRRPGYDDDSDPIPRTGEDDGSPYNVPDPCPVCGHLPCTCDGGQRKTILVKLSEYHKLSLYTDWEERFQFDDRLLTIQEFIKELFGQIPHFFNGEEDLQMKWQHPETRRALLEVLDEAGFAEEKLEMLKKVLKMDKCDLLDVLQYIAFNTEPMEREKRAEIVRKQYVALFNKKQQEFDNLILEYYCRNGFKELGMDKLKPFIDIHFHTIADAKRELQCEVPDIRQHFIELQKELYPINIHVHGNFHVDQGDVNINTYNE